MAKKHKILQSVPLEAIDLGSHNVRAMAAEVTDHGLRVLGIEASNKFQCMERGVVISPANAGFMINEALKLLANRIRIEALPSAFVSVGGRTMQIVSVASKRDQIRKREVTQELLDEMELECKKKIEARNPDVAVLDLVPYYYTLDGKQQDEPPTPVQQATIVQAHFMAFVGKKDLEQKVIDSFSRSAKRMERMYVRPDALLNALASDDDMVEGCVILDFGAQTTTLTAYKGTQYLHNKVIPLGGYDITRDIEQIGMSLAYAEQLKCKYGCASANLLETNHRFRVPAPNVPGGEVALMEKDLADIISSRLDQIINPLMEIINKEADRYKVLYITGGGAMLKGIDQYLQQKTTIPVMYGSHACFLSPDTDDEMCMPMYSSLVGTLLLGNEYRKKHPLAAATDTGLPIFKALRDMTLDLFTEQETNREQENE
jgi:cell division protein FtsA